MRRLILALAIGVLVAACGDAFDPAAPGVTHPDSTMAGIPDMKDQYIVTLAPGARGLDVARGHGLDPDFVYTRALNGFAARIPAQALQGLERNPHVERIEPDVVMAVSQTVQSAPPWGLDRIDQRSNKLDGQYIYDWTGAGVTVYVLDTGIRFSHHDFGGRAVPGFDAFGGDATDCHGHGTHVAGTIGAATYGVAKGARMVSVRVLSCTGSGSASGVIAGLDWAAQHATGPAVINMSLGGNANASVDEAVQRVVAAGLTVVAAAGNSAKDACGVSPARAPEVITTGATEANDTRWNFSNWGSCLDIFAPGRSILSTAFDSDSRVASKSGTSMAAPHVAGAVALILEEAPESSPGTVAATLLERASRGVVAEAYSDNNHLLHTLGSGVSGPEPGNAPPIASFTYECDALTCSFRDESVDPDGAVVQWHWSFGDGGSAAAPNPDRTYALAGTYRVTLTVTDDGGAQATISHDVQVGDDSSPPVASFDVTCSLLECVFNDESTAGSATITQWDWDFGDGSSASFAPMASATTHVYDAPGSYAIRLTVTDSHGQSASTARTLIVDGITLEVTAHKDRGQHRVVLAWSGTSADGVDILLNGTLLDRVVDTGTYEYRTSSRGKGRYAFRVCESESARCSAERAVTF